MSVPTRKRFFLFAALLGWSLCAPALAQAADTWTRITSRNFVLVGNSSAGDLRRMAARLEQFRGALMRLLPLKPSDSPMATTVIVFKDDASYRPFMPLYGGQPSAVAGYFQSNQDLDYITLSVDEKHAPSPFSLAFHEYVHALVQSRFREAPLWLNEGLAEYYSTFETEDSGRRVTLGVPLKLRIETLKTAQLLPLETLLTAGHNSPHYTETRKRALFYAQSWALVHYLMNVHGSGPRPNIARALETLASSANVSEAVRGAFGVDLKTLETEFRAYLQSGKFPKQNIEFAEPVRVDSEIQSDRISEAETQFYLGDLLLHTHRLEEAAPYLQKALKLDPALSKAHAALGLLRARQGRYPEAQESLRRALAGGENNYLIHYYYAYALSREIIGSDAAVDGYYSPEATRIMRAELKRTLELAPQFTEAYRLLAFINLVMNEELEQSTALLKEALRLAPGRQEYAYLLAQVYLRREEFAAARQTLEAILNSGAEARMHLMARTLLDTVTGREALMARLRAEREAAELADLPSGEIQPCDAPQRPGPFIKRQRFDGQQACGRLVQVECADEGVTLFVVVGAQTLRLSSPSLNKIRFVTYTTEVRGKMSCGLYNSENPVLVTFRSAKDRAAQIDGEVIAVEFMPRSWNR